MARYITENYENPELLKNDNYALRQDNTNYIQTCKIHKMTKNYRLLPLTKELMPDLKKTEKSKKRGGREGRKYVTVTGCAWKRRKPVVNKNGHGRYIKRHCNGIPKEYGRH